MGTRSGLKHDNEGFWAIITSSACKLTSPNSGVIANVVSFFSRASDNASAARSFFTPEETATTNVFLIRSSGMESRE